MRQVALVVGANGGIGAAIARQFLSKGLKVYACFYRNQDQVLKIKKEYENCEIVQCDIKSEEKLEALVASIVGKEGRIDIVANCVTSPLKLKPFEALTGDAFREDIDTILFGSRSLFKAVLPNMKKARSGIVVNLLTSTITETPPARMSSYIVAKYGLLGLTKCLAAETERFNLKIFGLSPAFVETALIDVFPGKLLEMEREKQDDKKLLQAEDIAQAVWQITQHAERYQNGEHFIIKEKKDLLSLCSDGVL